jgi:hypothetical protein
MFGKETVKSRIPKTLEKAEPIAVQRKPHLVKTTIPVAKRLISSLWLLYPFHPLNSNYKRIQRLILSLF